MVGCSAWETSFYRGAIPAEIGLSFGLATTGSTMSLWMVAVPIRHSACGGAIFKLSDATIAAIRARGLDVLKDARQGRDHTDKSDRLFHRYTYEPWQATPLPFKWEFEGVAWHGLECMNLERSLVRDINSAARAPGSFYTSGSSKRLLLIPDLKLIVFTYTH